MALYHSIDPTILTVGPLQIRWYGLMYIIGIISSYILVQYQISKKHLAINQKAIEEIYFYCIIGLMVGGRLGYVIFYNFSFYLENPFEILAVWHGGMSFHGGLIGALLASGYIIKKRKIDFWPFADIIIVTVPIGLGLGRIGNFINGELCGRITTVPWAMIFPNCGSLPRHPSQLYEAIFEGAILFITLWLLKDWKKAQGKLLALFLIGYGAIRFVIEFFREPDSQIGFVFMFLTMGQLLCFFMILIGVLLLLTLRGSTKKGRARRNDAV
jgi:phosphatidylglycerol:prolipoprotein diacylglycerol transferase